MQKHVNDVSNFLLFNFVRFDFDKASMKPCKSQKALRRKDYLLASSIATATATVIPTMGLLPAPDNRRSASLQARLQASRGRLLRERCAKRNKVQSTKQQAKRRCCASKEYQAHHLNAIRAFAELRGERLTPKSLAA